MYLGLSWTLPAVAVQKLFEVPQFPGSSLGLDTQLALGGWSTKICRQPLLPSDVAVVSPQHVTESQNS